VCLEKRVNSAGDPVAARVGLRNAMTGGMALIAIARAVIGVAIAGGWMVLLAIGFFVMGSGLAPPYALAPPAGAVGSFARASGFQDDLKVRGWTTDSGGMCLPTAPVADYRGSRATL
jgi:hypothetical protein